MKLAQDLEILIPSEQIAQRVRDLGRQIERDYHGKDLVLLGVLKGSYIFISDLARAVDLPLAVDFIGLSSYGEATESSGVVKITSDLSKPIEDKHVLIVEDIVDTGLTMRYLLDNLATRHPASVKLCTLLHKPARARTKIPIDYLGFQIEDRFVVGYGLDANERYRNVPFIGVKRGS
ncbi:MAG TPA: hypoxanthine phosphoribosyltransferase [Myxococcales bacterium]|nr:hypoxanthine phosphoribosyltransferase [Myxococcales bacterium]